MNDEQLVSALIASYRARGIDMSYLLSDPLFEKLPGAVKVRAVQTHAKELAEGINPGFTRNDYTRVGVESAYAGVRGAMLGAPIGAALSAASGGLGMSPLKAALLAAGVLGLTGASVGAFGALGGVGQRKALKTSLRAVSVDPSPIAAIGALSSSHNSTESRSLREKILNRVSDDLSNVAHNAIPPYLEQIHLNILSQP